jgi:hypothetical protein
VLKLKSSFSLITTSGEQENQKTRKTSSQHLKERVCDASKAIKGPDILSVAKKG